MDSFQDKLQRLKECLGLKQDQQVAQALGMTKATLSDRKRRNSFPDEHVVGLKASRADLDVVYVLTGRRVGGHVGRVMDAQVGAVAGAENDMKQLVLKAVDVLLASEEIRRPLVEELIGLMPWCTDDDIRLLTQIAARLGGRRRATFPASEEPRSSEFAPGSAERDLEPKVKSLSAAINDKVEVIKSARATRSVRPRGKPGV